MLSSSLDLKSPLSLRVHASLWDLHCYVHVCACAVVNMPCLDNRMAGQGERGFAIHELEDRQTVLTTLTALTASRAGYASLAL